MAKSQAALDADPAGQRPLELLGKESHLVSEFLTKPFSDEVLLNAIRQALERSRIAIGHETQMEELRNRYGALTPRERQVMALVVSGLLNKQVGGELGISEITVKAHRGKVMEKMKAGSLADLVKMAAKLRIARAPGASSTATE